MTSTVTAGQAPLAFRPPPLAVLCGGLATAALALSIALQSYAAHWLIGGLGLVFLAVRGTRRERLVLAGLLLLSAAAAPGMGYFGVRQCAFIAMFMLFARYLVVPALPAVAIFALAELIWVVRQGEVSALFVLAPTMLLLVEAARLRLDTQIRSPGTRPQRPLAPALLTLGALLTPFLGSGSRAALFVWLANAVRRISVPMAAAVMLLIGLLAALPDVPVVGKLVNSLAELTQPVAEGGAISQRALENLIFLSWAETATPGEWLTGSAEPVFVPGAALGYDDDLPFVPHNQLFGLLFQFGLGGVVLIFCYLAGLWQHMRPFPAGRFLFFVLLVPGFLVIAAFNTPDIAIMAGAINLVVMQRRAALRR